MKTIIEFEKTHTIILISHNKNLVNLCDKIISVKSNKFRFQNEKYIFKVKKLSIGEEKIYSFSDWCFEDKEIIKSIKRKKN